MSFVKIVIRFAVFSIAGLVFVPTANATYVGNDPINQVDPTGKYGRGTGFTDKQWEQFDTQQQQAATEISDEVGQLQDAAISLLGGGKIDTSTQSVIDNFGKDVGLGNNNIETATRMLGASNNLAKTVGMLQDDGSKGFMANAKFDPNTNIAGMMQLGSKTMTINSAFINNSAFFRSTLGHESLHGVGLDDQRVNGAKAYSLGSLGQRAVFGSLPSQHPGLAIQNPDSLMELVYPTRP